MSDTVIKIENLSKLYKLGLVSTGTISHDINRFWAKIRGKEDPFLKIGESNDRSSKGNSDYVWALKDINLEIKRGDRIGIIGKNGAGKSTLLKILSEVTGPTTGSIKIKGRTASLLEVGTGFHPELTGRENVYMNGTILGMKHWEVKKKLDEIVDFAGVERYIDTPVKRYSSGMMVRLGFAVAAHLEPDILVVDEVLAVGDAEFQKKAIGKMKDVSEGQGRTILFVSHNMGAVKNLCKKAIILKNGLLAESGDSNNIVDKYLENESISKSVYKFSDESNNTACVKNVSIYNNKKILSRILTPLESFEIKVKIIIKEYIPHFIAGIGIQSSTDVHLHTSFSKSMDIYPGEYEYSFLENEKYYSSGKYKVVIGLSSRENTIQYIDDVVCIEIGVFDNKDILVNPNVGYIMNQMKIEVNKI